MTAPSPLISRWNVTFDKNLELRPDSAAAISTATTTTEPTTFDLGDGVWHGLWVVDVQSITTSATASIVISLLGSNSSTFATTTGLWVREIACLRLGDVAVGFGESADSKLGRYKMPVWNVKMDEYCRYLRLVTVTAGTGAIDFRSYLGSSTQSF